MKLIIWHGVVAVLTWRLWNYGNNLSTAAIENIDIEPVALLNVALLAAVIALGFLLFQKRIWIVTAALIVWIPHVAYFGFSQLISSGLAILILFFWWANQSVMYELERGTKVRSARLVRVGALPVILGIFLLTSFAAYQSPNIQAFKSADSLPSSIQEIVKPIVEKTIGTKISTRNEREKETLINEIARQTVHDFNIILRPYFQYAPPLVAFILFLILWGLSWIFVIVSSLMGWIIFRILKKIGLIQVQEKDIKAEVLVV